MAKAAHNHRQSGGETKRRPRDRVDPIFSAILNHRIAYQNHDAACGIYNLINGARIDGEKGITAPCVADDDHRMALADKHVSSMSAVMHEAEDELVRIRPTTLEGVIALLEYAAEHVKCGCGFWESDDVNGWSYRLHRLLAGVLRKQIAAKSPAAAGGGL